MLPNLAHRQPPKEADYTEGMWTPIFSGDGVAGTFTYTNQQGYYTRMGNRCFINGYILISAIAVNPTGNMRVMNLPFPASGDANNYGALTLVTGNLDFDVGFSFVIGETRANQSFFYLTECGDNVGRAVIQGSTFDNNPAVLVIFSGTYKI